MFRVSFGISGMRVDTDSGRESAIGGNQRNPWRQLRELGLWLTTLTNFDEGLSIEAAIKVFRSFQERCRARRRRRKHQGAGAMPRKRRCCGREVKCQS